jgi:hypothetical protein
MYDIGRKPKQHSQRQATQQRQLQAQGGAPDDSPTPPINEKRTLSHLTAYCAADVAALETVLLHTSHLATVHMVAQTSEPQHQQTQQQTRLQTPGRWKANQNHEDPAQVTNRKPVCIPCRQGSASVQAYPAGQNPPVEAPQHARGLRPQPAQTMPQRRCRAACCKYHSRQGTWPEQHMRLAASKMRLLRRSHTATGENTTQTSRCQPKAVGGSRQVYIDTYQQCTALPPPCSRTECKVTSVLRRNTRETQTCPGPALADR